MSLQPHQQRVVEEKNELDEKLKKLIEFFYNPIWVKLTSDEKARLFRQSQAMREYSEILGERIAAFLNEPHVNTQVVKSDSDTAILIRNTDKRGPDRVGRRYG